VRKIIVGLLAVGALGVGCAGALWAADEGTSTTPQSTPPAAAAPAAPAAAAPAGGAAAPVAAGESPQDLVKNTPKGKLVNPYAGDYAAVAEEGHAKFLSNGCPGCHGPNGGGGMGATLSDKSFVYGSDDDTLFRLIVLGSLKLIDAGYPQKEPQFLNVYMPPQTVRNPDDIWKIIAWIKSLSMKPPSPQ